MQREDCRIKGSDQHGRRCDHRQIVSDRLGSLADRFDNPGRQDGHNGHKNFGAKLQLLRYLVLLPSLIEYRENCSHVDTNCVYNLLIGCKVLAILDRFKVGEKVINGRIGHLRKFDGRVVENSAQSRLRTTAAGARVATAATVARMR